jgi:hypothetical protein
VVSRVVDDVGDGLLVLLLGFDQPRPEAATEDVVAATVPLVEGACVGAVQVSHAVREVGGGSLEDEVVVVPHQALHVQAPAIPALDAPEDVEENASVLPVENDRRAVVALRPDVVMSSGGEVTARATHTGDGNSVEPSIQPGATLLARARCSHVTCQARDASRVARALGDLSELAGSLGVRLERPAGGYAATLERSRCWWEGQ